MKKTIYGVDGEDFSKALKMLDTFLLSGRLGGIIFEKSKTKYDTSRTVKFCIDLEKEEYKQLKEFAEYVKDVKSE